MVEPLVIHQSRAKALLGVALAAAMLGGCLWLLTQGEPHSGRGAIARYVGTPIFGALTLIWLKTLIFPATLTLSREGLRLGVFPGGFSLGWGEVTGAQVVNPYFVEKVVLTTTAGKKKHLPAAWSRPPAQMLQAILEAKDQAAVNPAPVTSNQAAIVS